MELFKLLGTIAIDNQEANNGIEETTGKAEKSESKIGAAFKKIGTAVVTYFAVDKIVDFGKACVNAAADANAAASQFTQVFGDLEGEASANLSKIASDAGIMETRMKGSYTKIAAFAKTTGMDTADALSLADRAMIAVADSAAFYDRSLEDTTESLQSFLKGNFENDAALGLSCTEVTRNAAAMKLFGLEYKELSEQQKQLTLLQMVEDANKLSGAMGQAARESDTWANQTGNLKQAWTDFKAMIGSNFLESAVGGVKKMTAVIVELSGKVPVVVEWFKSMYEKAASYFPAIKDYFQSLWAEANNVWNSIGKPIFDMVQSTIQTVASVFGAKMPEIKEFVSQCFADISAFWTNNLLPCFTAIGEFISGVLAPAFDAAFNGFIKTAVDTAFSAIKSLWDGMLKPVLVGITDFLTGVFTGDWSKAFEGIAGIADGVLSGIATTFNATIDNAKNIVSSGLEFIRGLFNFEWSLPKLKLPHFSISGEFSFKPPSVPKLSVDWYAKAMQNPMLLTSPTIFGYDEVSGRLQGGGEAGAEVVSGANTLMQMIGAVVEGKTATQNERIIDLLSALQEATVSGNKELLQALLSGQVIKINEREFGRTVREYA